MYDTAEEVLELARSFQRARDEGHSEGVVERDGFWLRLQSEPGRAPTPGQRFTRSPSYTTWREQGAPTGKIRHAVELASTDELAAWIRARAVTLPTAGLEPYREPGAVARPANLTVSQLVTTIPVESGRIDVAQTTSRTSAAAGTAYGVLLPETTAVLAALELLAFRLGVYAGMTLEIYESTYRLARAIDVLLDQDWRMNLERQILAGSGAANNMTGILNTSGITVVARGMNTWADTIGLAVEALQLVEVTGPITAVLHPSALRAMRLQKDGQGNYLDLDDALGDVDQVIGHPGVTAGSAVVGDFSAFQVFIVGDGLRLVASDEYSDNWLRGTIVVKAESRVTGSVVDPTRFVICSGL